MALSPGPARADLLDLLPPILEPPPENGGDEGNEGGEGNENTGIVLQNISRTGDGVLTIVTTVSTDQIQLLPNIPSLPLLLGPETTITLTASLPPGFALTSAACSEGVELVDLGNLQYGISLDRELVQDALTCTFNTINALGASVGTIVPMLARRNEVLMGLDVGLDRQIDLLSPGAGGDDESDSTKPFSLGGPSPAGFLTESFGPSRLGGMTESGEPSRIAFATSLQQSRQNSQPPPYALGAASRPPPPVKSKFDVWAEGYFAHFEDDSGVSGSDGRTGVLYVGADYLISPTALIGTLVQLDDTDQNFDWLSQHASATGWMAGPYATVRLPKNLFFQARAAWGQSDNEITLDKGIEDHFDTERWLVRGTLLGQYRSGRWQFQPRASVGYIEEDQEGYTNGYGIFVPSQTVSLGQAKAGSQIAYHHRLADGTVLEPSVLLEGIWNFHEDAGAINLDDFVTDGDVRARAEAGVTFITLNGIAVGGSVSYDGIGSSDYHAIGGRARVRVPFN